MSEGRFFVLLICLCCLGSLKAQVNEGRGWLGLSVERELHKDWLLQAEGQIRTNRDFSAFQQALFEGTLNYDLPNGWELFGLYRASFQTDDMVNRVAAGATKRWNFKPFYLTMRGQFQHEMARVEGLQGNWRFKISGRYRFNKRWSGYLNAEHFAVQYPEFQAYERIRLGAASRFNRKDHQIKLTYYYQRNIDLSSAHILSLKYGWSWDKPKKKKRIPDNN